MLSIWNSFDPPSLDKITDKIYISNERGAHDKKMLTDRGVTHILVAGNFLQKKFPSDFKYLQLPINDFPNQDITYYFQDVVNFIDEADKVLVHCAAGISRSSSMIIAYLMIRNKVKYQEAHDLVKKKRPIICPNRGFVNQLKELERFLESGETDLSKLSTKAYLYQRPKDNKINAVKAPEPNQAE